MEIGTEAMAFLEGTKSSDLKSHDHAVDTVTWSEI